MLNSTKAEGPKAEGPNISSDLKWNCHVSEIASYADALEMCDLPFLYDCRDTLTTKLFEEICCDPNHKLHHLLPEVNRSSVNLRTRRKFNLPICKTNRL